MTDLQKKRLISAIEGLEENVDMVEGIFRERFDEQYYLKGKELTSEHGFPEHASLDNVPHQTTIRYSASPEELAERYAEQMDLDNRSEDEAEYYIRDEEYIVTHLIKFQMIYINFIPRITPEEFNAENGHEDDILDMTEDISDDELIDIIKKSDDFPEEMEREMIAEGYDPAEYEYDEVLLRIHNVRYDKDPDVMIKDLIALKGEGQTVLQFIENGGFHQYLTDNDILRYDIELKALEEMGM